jgi:biotin-(acetyl-CoA carboxylase) ligase
VVGGRKIAGILIEARSRDDEAFIILGIGINVRPVDDPAVPNATSLAETSPRESIDLDDAIIAFIEFLDEKITAPPDSDSLLETWRSLAIHRPGDRIQSVVANRTIEGTWIGIDDSGRALLRHGGEEIAVAAGELMLAG